MKCSRCGVSFYQDIQIVDENHPVNLCKLCRDRVDHPYWPRGRINGQRIIGLEAKMKIDLTDWKLFPRFNSWTRCFRWLCVWLWIHFEYKEL